MVERNLTLYIFFNTTPATCLQKPDPNKLLVHVMLCYTRGLK